MNPEKSAAPKKPYKKPALKNYGTIERLTETIRATGLLDGGVGAMRAGTH